MSIVTQIVTQIKFLSFYSTTYTEKVSHHIIQHFNTFVERIYKYKVKYPRNILIYFILYLSIST